MERNGIERSHGEALDCQTIGYISVHGSTYSKYDAHIHSHMTQTHTHTHRGKYSCSTAHFTFYVTFVLSFCWWCCASIELPTRTAGGRGRKEKEEGLGGCGWQSVGYGLINLKLVFPPLTCILICRVASLCFSAASTSISASAPCLHHLPFATCHSPLCSCAIIETSRINCACYVPPPVRSTLFSIYLQYIIAFNAHTQCSPKVRSLTRTA